MQEKFRHLIDKYLRNELLPEGERELRQWIEDPENRKALKEEVKLHHRINDALGEFEENADRDRKVLHPEGQGIVVSLRRVLGYAAAAVVLFGIGYWVFTGSPDQSISELTIPDEAITLDPGDGTEYIIIPGNEGNITREGGDVVTVQRGDTLVYTGIHSEQNAVWNTLRVPYGKTFRVRLSDGTVVHLNAGTELRYPGRFGAESRIVDLEGEAFFEVEKDHTRPFVVRSGGMDVEVLGTKFNVSTYQNDPEETVVLTEGEVGLSVPESTTSDQTVLKPGEMGIRERNRKDIRVQEVDVHEYTAWMEGRVIFHNRAFDDALRILERKYNVRIENRYPELNAERFRGVFDEESIEEVMNTFAKSRVFDYRIEDNVIVVEKP